MTRNGKTRNDTNRSILAENSCFLRVISWIVHLLLETYIVHSFSETPPWPRPFFISLLEELFALRAQCGRDVRAPGGIERFKLRARTFRLQAETDKSVSVCPQIHFERSYNV